MTWGRGAEGPRVMTAVEKGWGQDWVSAKG